jgi:bla regulator protein BlaR1
MLGLNFTKKGALAVAWTAALAVPIGVGIMSAPQLRAQSKAAAQPSFEVASVKATDPNSRSPTALQPLAGGRLRGTNYTLFGLVVSAFGVPRDQISGGPGWFDSDRFEIDAKAPDDFSQDPDRALLGGRDGLPKRMALMLQTLLEGRFRLKAHWETKERTVYALVIAKGGPKLQEVQPNDASERCCWTFNTGRITARFRSMPWLADALRARVSAPVLDQTGLKGVYDFTLEWQDERDRDAKAGPSSIFTAVQEELGLKLESQKGSVQVLVIDHAEKPSEN